MKREIVEDLTLIVISTVAALSVIISYKYLGL